jgi:hypothetical protein
MLDSSQACFQEAPEPSNLIWENLGTSWAEKISRKSIIFLIILSILTISFLLILACELPIIAYQLRYPSVKNTIN